MSDTNQKMSYEQLVEECKRLRDRTERSEAEFFAFLMITEREHEAVWREAGCSEFEQFVRSNNLCKPDRYRQFAAGADLVGLAAALENGASWTMAAGRIATATPAVIEEFKARAVAFRVVNHTAPSEEAVREWRAQLDAPSTTSKIVSRASELHRLRAEVTRLTAENSQLKARIAAIKAGQNRKEAA